MNQLNREWFAQILPMVTLVAVTVWRLRGWWDQRQRDARVVGDLRELP
jgi:hypothetical protein